METKICSKCLEEKPVTEFNKRTNESSARKSWEDWSDEYRARCKTCEKRKDSVLSAIEAKKRDKIRYEKKKILREKKYAGGTTCLDRSGIDLPRCRECRNLRHPKDMVGEVCKQCAE